MKSYAIHSQQKFFEPKTDTEIKIIQQSAVIVCKIIEKAKKSIEIGITTKDLDDIISQEIKKFNCKPAFLNYRGYPANSCISIDTELVHGIPNKNKKISYGQIVSIDVGIIFNGFYGDAATTVLIDRPQNNKSTIKLNKIWHLLEVTYESMFVALPNIKDGNRVGDISSAIQEYVESNGFTVIRDYVGHAIGRQLHEKPDIPNFGTKGEGPRILSGMVLCLEPMVSMGDYKTKVLNDGWTVIMADGSLSAHYEHMFLVKECSAEILTDTEIIKPQRLILD